LAKEKLPVDFAFRKENERQEMHDGTHNEEPPGPIGIEYPS
jgi:hypothetical protein